MMNILLKVSNLCISISGKKILNDLNLNIKYGEVHVIMGPNGAGKSTLGKVLTGNKTNISELSGSVFFDKFNIFNLSPNELALKGLFLAFQYPVSIPGLTNIQFLKHFLNNKRKKLGLEPIEMNDFLKLIEKFMVKLNMNRELLYRYVNDDFSGGEKKKNEVLQMFLLEPKLSILDEIDSGLDIDSLKCIAVNINSLHSHNNSLLIITHYNHILKYINVNYIHILCNGTIVKTGGRDLISYVENNGYSSFIL